jgi:flagella basal body P-ring formation protein FlgA
MTDTSPGKRARHAGAVAGVLAAVLAALVPAAAADFPAQAEPVRVYVRPGASVDGTQIMLSDVLVLRSGDARFFDRLRTITIPLGPGGTARITHDQITTALHQAGINVGDVLLSGAAVCEVTRAEPADDVEPVPAPVASRQKPALPKRPTRLARPGAKIAEDSVVLADDEEAGGAVTLADVLTTYVNSQLKDGDATATLQFEAASRDFIELTTPPFDFVIQDGKTQGFGGLREFRVAIQQDGITQRNVQLFARVTITRKVLVAASDLAIGAFVKPGDFVLEERTFAADDKSGMSRPEAVVGQRLKRFIKRGEILSADDLRPEPLVQRSRPVTVLSSASGVSVRLTGVALDNGLMGETVRVRIGPDRGPRREARGVVTAVGTVQLQE